MLKSPWNVSRYGQMVSLDEKGAFEKKKNKTDIYTKPLVLRNAAGENLAWSLRIFLLLVAMHWLNFLLTIAYTNCYCDVK